MRPVDISETLAVIVGKGPMPRTAVPKKLWEYIREHKLQDQTDKRIIHPDQKLAAVLDSLQPISMFQMTGKVSKHLKELEMSDKH